MKHQRVDKARATTRPDDDQAKTLTVTRELSQPLFRKMVSGMLSDEYERDDVVEFGIIALDEKFRFAVSIYPNDSSKYDHGGEPFIPGPLLRLQRFWSMNVDHEYEISLEIAIYGNARHTSIRNALSVSHGVFQCSVLNEFYEIGFIDGKPLHRYRSLSLQFTLRIQVPRLNIKIARCQYLQRLEMYQNSKKCGDIILRSLSNTEQKETAVEGEPPKKRRRIDDNKSTSQNPAHSENTEIKMSSIILRSASAVFGKMLENNMREKRENVIEIAADAKDVDDMIYFVTVHRLRKGANPRSLIKVAHLYEVVGLLDACTLRIIEELKVWNFVESVQIFNKYELKEGYTKLVEFGKRHLTAIKDTDEYSKLPYHFRFGILESGVNSDIVKNL